MNKEVIKETLKELPVRVISLLILNIVAGFVFGWGFLEVLGVSFVSIVILTFYDYDKRLKRKIKRGKK